MASGVSRNSQPIKVTPRCCARMQTSLDRHTDPLPLRAARAAPIPIEPDPRRLADQVGLGHKAPGPSVVAVVAVISHHEVHTRGDVRDELLAFAEQTRGPLVSAAQIAARVAPVAP